MMTASATSIAGGARPLPTEDWKNSSELIMRPTRQQTAASFPMVPALKNAIQTESPVLEESFTQANQPAIVKDPIVPSDVIPNGLGDEESLKEHVGHGRSLQGLASNDEGPNGVAIKPEDSLNPAGVEDVGEAAVRLSASTSSFVAWKSFLTQPTYVIKNPLLVAVDKTMNVQDAANAMYGETCRWAWAKVNGMQGVVSQVQGRVLDAAPEKLRRLVSEDVSRIATGAKVLALEESEKVFEEYKQRGAVRAVGHLVKRSCNKGATMMGDMLGTTWSYGKSRIEDAVEGPARIAQGAVSRASATTHRIVQGARGLAQEKACSAAEIARAVVNPVLHVPSALLASYFPPAGRPDQRAVDESDVQQAEERPTSPRSPSSALAHKGREVLDQALGTAGAFYQRSIGERTIPIINYKVETVVGRVYTEVARRATALDVFPSLKTPTPTPPSAVAAS